MLKLYNTLTNKKEQFRSLEKGKVKLYTCGPTVYDYAHIGNLTAYTYADLLRRYLDFSGYETRHIINITDVGHLTADDLGQADSGEDKMLKASVRERKTPEEIATFYTDCFFTDSKKMNFKKAHFYPRATTHIPQMIKIIEGLIEKGLAYEKNGNVFYDVEKFEHYGKLSNKKLAELKKGARLEDHPDKRKSYDFALWLKAPKDHLMQWESPWSKGYPGWHIECSAMSMEYLGETLDIHTGGEDHIFPHHENEIAQSEGATGRPFSTFWLHNRFLFVDGSKMSKSKGNFYTLSDITEKGYEPMAFRLLILSSHYRSNINFSWKSMDQARSNFEKIARFVERIEIAESFPQTSKEEFELDKFENKIKAAMDDDLNSPLALSVVYELISDVNKKISENALSQTDGQSIFAFWKKINSIFGLKFEKKKELIPEEVSKLAEKRELARKEKAFEKSDQLRDEIEKLGFVVEDTADGQKVSKK